VIRRLCLVLCMTLALALAAHAECIQEDIVETCQESSCLGEIFVELERGASVTPILDSFGLVALDEIVPFRFHLLGLSVPAGQDVGEAVKGKIGEIKQSDLDATIARIEPHRHLETPEGVQLSIPDLGVTAGEEDLPTQPAAGAINAPLAHEQLTGAGVTVAIIDTGMSFAHPQIANRLLTPGGDHAGGDGTGRAQPDGLDNDQDGLADESAHHATFIAGLVHVVSPDARILPIRALEEDGKGTAFGVAKAILSAVAQGADVINLSHGLLHDARAIDAAIAEALARGVVIVVAAGNRGEPLVDASIVDGCVSYPAALPDVITVAAVDGSFVRAPFSDYGPQVDLSAPGLDLLSAAGDAQFAAWSGTSFAAPLVSGAVALILQKYPCLTPVQVGNLLAQTAQPDANPDLAGQMGAGVLDLAALAAAVAPDRCSLRMTKGSLGTVGTWSPVEGAMTYDMIRGSVAVLDVTASGRVDLGAVSCVVNDSPATDSAVTPDTSVPVVGSVRFYLFRDDLDPSYGTDSAGHPRTPGMGDCPAGP